MERARHPTLWQTRLMRQPQLAAPLKERLAVVLLARLQTPQADMTRPVRRRIPVAPRPVPGSSANKQGQKG
ncbi:hypothetical protein AERO9A_190015 [Aeromonas salmonicida]|nr:hypothetical protein AERO9A_190015 [Aeromonas salmonicida]